jgi:hypothetical protein
MQQPTSSLAVPAASEPHSHRPSAPTRRQRGGGGGGTAAEAERFYTAAEEEQEQEGEQEAASLPPPPPPPPQQQPRPPSKNGNNNHDDWEWMLDGGACAGFGSGGDEGGKERARSKEGGGGGGENENDENENEKTRSTSIFAAVEFSRGHLGFAWLDVNRREVSRRREAALYWSFPRQKTSFFFFFFHFLQPLSHLDLDLFLPSFLPSFLLLPPSLLPAPRRPLPRRRRGTARFLDSVQGPAIRSAGGRPREREGGLAAPGLPGESRNDGGDGERRRGAALPRPSSSSSSVLARAREGRALRAGRGSLGSVLRASDR